MKGRQIGSPEGKKISIMIKIKLNKRSDGLDFVKTHVNLELSLKVNRIIGSFYK